MTCRQAPACRTALAEATIRWPGRDRASDGVCGDEAHANRVSDHNPDADGYATAFDIDHDPDHGFDADHWSEVLRTRRDPRVKYVIYDRRMFASYSTATRAAWTWGPYTGPNAHKSHMHVSVLQEQKFNTAKWWEGGADDMPITEAEWERLESIVDTKIRAHVDKAAADVVRIVGQEANGRLVETLDAIRNGFAYATNGRNELRRNVRRIGRKLGLGLQPDPDDGELTEP